MALLDPKTVISPAKLKDYLLVLLPKDDKSQYLAQAGYNKQLLPLKLNMVKNMKLLVI